VKKTLKAEKYGTYREMLFSLRRLKLLLSKRLSTGRYRGREIPRPQHFVDVMVRSKVVRQWYYHHCPILWRVLVFVMLPRCCMSLAGEYSNNPLLVLLLFSYEQIVIAMVCIVSEIVNSLHKQLIIYVWWLVLCHSKLCSTQLNTNIKRKGSDRVIEVLLEFCAFCFLQSCLSYVETVLSMWMKAQNYAFFSYSKWMSKG